MIISFRILMCEDRWLARIEIKERTAPREGMH